MSAALSIEFRGTESNRLVGEMRDGGGTPVLLLHGAGQTRHMWEKTANDLAEAGLTPIAVDLRGHGASEWVKSSAYSVLDFCCDIAAVSRAVEARFSRPPVAVGASLGGIAALGAELFEGPLFSALVMVDLAPRIDTAGANRVQSFMMEHMGVGFASIEEAAQAILRTLPEEVRQYRVMGLEKAMRLGPDGRFRWHWDPTFFDPKRGVSHRAMEFSERMLRRLPLLNCELLLLRGTESDTADDRLSQELLARAPCARDATIEGAGHMLISDRNERFLEEVLAFLRSVRALPAA